MKKRGTRFLLHALAAGAIVLMAQNAQSQTVVYSNALGYNGNFYFNNANPAVPASAGNEVVLAGNATSDYITLFQVQFSLINSGASPLSGNPTGNEEVELSFYDNDGSLASGYPSPGMLIWSSGFSSMSTIGLTSFTEGNRLIYIPDVSVPQDFTWTMTFEDVPSGESAGMGLFSEPSGPAVGGNFDDAWVNSGPGWQLDEAASGNPGLQFGAVLVAGSAPSQPGIITTSLAGTNLVLNGTNGLVGTYYVLMSTNVALPLNLWTPVATNALSASGNFTITVTNTVTPNVRQRFYVLQTQ
jgi:hypothetical protein